MCIPVPRPVLPTLPAPLTFSPPTPPFPGIGDLVICCKLPPIPVKVPPVPIPVAVLNPAAISALNAFIATMNTWVKNLPLKCPKE